MFKKVMGVAFGIVILIGLSFVLELGGLQWTKYFQPKKENIRREVFENTRSYNEGKIQQLAKYRLEYIKTTDVNQKEAIKSTVRILFANYDEEKLPKELKEFLTLCKGA